MTDETKPRRFLHGARSDGSAHCWAPFETVEELAILAGRLGPVAPDDTTWDVTETTTAPRQEET